MPERIDVHADRRDRAEARLQVPLPVQTLARERLAHRHIAVRLHPPAADVDPSPFGDALANALEEFGILLLHP